ncbi:MAG: DUF402 domain-containing protein [Chloroflexi bacterium]|nr:MAG: DUF402 domain-containing protein [Chloroflexota bacterium]
MGRQARAPITERKTRLDGSVIDYACELIRVAAGQHAVVRYVTQQDRAIQGTDLVLKAGTLTIGHFWADRPYNVYHWLAGDRTIAFYVNVAADTRISEDLIAYTDLVIDILLRPSAAIEVLDEDELPPTIEPRHRLAIAKALEVCVTEPRRLIAEIERETRAALG